MNSSSAGSDSTVTVHPTLGDVDDLARARAEHVAHDAHEPHQTAGRPVGEPSLPDDDVVGGPTLGALDELRFAHHAHACEHDAPPA